MISSIIQNITAGFTDIISAFVNAIKSGFTSFLFENGESGALSTVAQYLLIFLGISIAVGLVWLVISMFKRGKANR